MAEETKERIRKEKKRGKKAPNRGHLSLNPKGSLAAPTAIAGNPRGAPKPLRSGDRRASARSPLLLVGKLSPTSAKREKQTLIAVNREDHRLRVGSIGTYQAGHVESIEAQARNALGLRGLLFPYGKGYSAQSFAAKKGGRDWRWRDFD